MTTVPLALTVMLMVCGDELRAPNTMVMVEGVEVPLAGLPAVSAARLQGLMVTDLPKAIGLAAGKVELVIVKMQEPNVSPPDAVAPPEATLNVGAVVPPGATICTVVAAVVPNSLTPLGKLNDRLLTAATFDAVTGALRF
jgi:hypothetical protein